MLKQITSTLFATTLASLTPAIASEIIPLDKLVQLDAHNVPEQVRVTNMKDPRGRILLDAHVRILDKLPKDWKHTGKIKLVKRRYFQTYGGT